MGKIKLVQNQLRFTQSFHRDSIISPCIGVLGHPH